MADMGTLKEQDFHGNNLPKSCKILAKVLPIVL